MAASTLRRSKINYEASTRNCALEKTEKNERITSSAVVLGPDYYYRELSVRPLEEMNSVGAAVATRPPEYIWHE